MPRKPTALQKKTAAIYVEKRGQGKNIGVSSAMKEAGYSEATARNPQQLAKSETWKAMLHEFMPEEDLLKVGREGLSAYKIVTSPTEPDKKVPDFSVRHKYYETGLELHGKIKTGNQVIVATQFNFSEDREKYT